MKSNFSNKTVLITGGTSGIGLATAKRFAGAGANVIVAARNDEGLAAAKHLIGESLHTVRADITRTEDLRQLFETAARRFGGIDVLFANAAVVKLAPIGETSDELFQQIVATNMKGTFDTLRLGIPVLRDGASVILTTSWLDRIGFAGSSVVSMTKAAVRSLARVAATELAARRIRVNAICPGAIETPLWGSLGLPPETLRAAGAAITAQIPLGRWGGADEVAGAVLFLASEESSYVNGIELQVDGGMA